MKSHPIGVMDSGSGGLSILQHVARVLPAEDFIYLGDHANLPYGTKSHQFIRARVKKLIAYLVEQHAKLIVVACNTATVAGIDDYRRAFPDIPIVGVVPVIKTIATQTTSGEVAVLTTPFTAQSQYQQDLIDTFADSHTVVTLASAKLVELVESTEDVSERIREELMRVLSPIKDRSIDAIALGCTHFAFVQEEMKRILSPSIRLYDSGAAVARHVVRVLEKNKLQRSGSNGNTIYYTTGDSRHVSAVYTKLTKTPVKARYVEL